MNKKATIVTLRIVLYDISDKFKEKLNNDGENSITSNVFRNSNRYLLDYDFTHDINLDQQPDEMSLDDYIEVVEELRSGYKLKAVQKVNDCTGWGLKNSKEFVDNLKKKL